VEPADATDKSVTWSSSNPDVAAVDENGVVAAIAQGTAIITVTTVDSGYQATSIITVSDSPLPTPTVDTLSNQLQAYVISGDVSGPLVKQLTNPLNQVEHHLSGGRHSQAAKHLEDFLKHLNNRSMQRHVTEEAKRKLESLANQLLESWSSK
jgi:hypothetical protein